MLPPSIPPPAVPTMQQPNYPPPMNSHKAPPMQQSMQNSNDYRPTQQKQNERIDYINSNNYNMNYGNHNQPSYNSSRPNSGPNVQISSYASNAPQNSIYDEYENQNVDSGHQQQQQQQQQQRNYIHSYGEQYYQDRNVQQSQQRIGRIADYDPISDGPRNSPMPPVQGATVVYNSSQKYHHQQQQQHQQPAHAHPSNNGRIGEISETYLQCMIFFYEKVLRYERLIFISLSAWMHICIIKFHEFMYIYTNMLNGFAFTNFIQFLNVSKCFNWNVF